MSVHKKTIENGVRRILEGLNVEHDGVKDTPSRVARMYEEILGNQNADEKEFKKSLKLFECPTKGKPVVIEDIRFVSFCEHHLVPFIGTAKITYYPKNKVLGLSKFVRVVDFFARRPQIQERLTDQIGRFLMSFLNCAVGVEIEAEHFCMSIRGVNRPGIKTKTVFDNY